MAVVIGNISGFEKKILVNFIDYNYPNSFGIDHKLKIYKIID